MIDASEFLDLMENGEGQNVRIQFGKIPSTYTTGRPTIMLDGMTVPTVKKYPYLSSYTPEANHRVMVVQGVIMGRII